MEAFNKAMERLGVRVGDLIRFKKDGMILEGYVMPPYAFTDPEIIVLKLRNGYNVGFLADEIKDLEIIGRIDQSRESLSIEKIKQREDLPRIKVIGTGGTIASFIEYSTGAVRPSASVEELIESIPEVAEIAYIDSETLFNILSENMKPEYWEEIARKIYESMREGFKGVVVTHGTDTMSFTASAIAFAIQNMSVPVVFVGSQRSSDRPSSDAALNFIGALIVASRSPIAESVIAMHSSSSDDLIGVYRGVKTRKMHTSRRDAFKSINEPPIALVNPYTKEIRITGRIFRERGDREPILMNGFEKKVSLLYSYPGIDPEIIDFLVSRGYRGIVIAGTGFGHVPEYLIPSIRRASQNGVAIAVTSQTLFGRVNLKVYQTGREMIMAGVIPCEDMLPEVAYVKLSWILRRTDNMEDVRRIMTANIAGEINSRHTEDLFIR
ncbi:MAG: Glu-tRNA(Gln) amidotransferase subunit GatD [Sulfolobales archaeon]